MPDTGQPSLRQHHQDGLAVRARPAAGAAAGTLFYIHGLGESGFCFEGVMADPRLAAWHHLALDQPGYGKSPWQPSPLDLSAVAARLAAWLGRRGGAPVVVVGHSMGGVIGVELASSVPVRALVNVEGNLSFEDCAASWTVASHALDAFLAAGRGALLDDVYRRGLEVGGAAWRGYFASLSLCDPRSLHAHSVELVARSRAETQAAQLAALGVPVRYLLGDPRGTGAHSRALLDAAGVPWQAIADAGHWPFLDQHDAFVDALVTFLAALS